MELYVGHLKAEVNYGDLSAAFRKFGRVNDIRLLDGYAFVNFDKTSDGMEALRKLDLTDLCGQRITVQRSRDDEKQEQDRSHRSSNPDEVIKCQLCREDIVKADLIDHIASKHLNYELHKCRRCEFRSIDGMKALNHAEDTGHQVLLNKLIGALQCERSACLEKMIKPAYQESLKAHLDGKDGGEAGDDWKRSVVRPPPAKLEEESSGEKSSGGESSTASYRETSSKSDEGSGKEAKKQTFIAPTLVELPPATSTGTASRRAPEERGSVGRVGSESATSAGGMLPPPATTSRQPRLASAVNAVGHQNVSRREALLALATEVQTLQSFQPNRDQCQLCLAVVVRDNSGKDRLLKRNHVRKEHLNTTAICPVSGCGFTVTSNNLETSGRIGCHVVEKHGSLNTLTSSEMATYEENRDRLRSAIDGVYRNCFPNAHGSKKERVPGKNRKHLDEDGDNSRPKRIKRE